MIPAVNQLSTLREYDSCRMLCKRPALNITPAACSPLNRTQLVIIIVVVTVFETKRGLDLVVGVYFDPNPIASFRPLGVRPDSPEARPHVVKEEPTVSIGSGPSFNSGSLMLGFDQDTDCGPAELVEDDSRNGAETGRRNHAGDGLAYPDRHIDVGASRYGD